ncbi:transposase [Pseudooceanicola sp. CBS1P-1]|uniref:Transposase n=1 Tax=Pseudooceanicola albus TaxID=2692189 RepID=A0A6L7GAH9_9RHOB|nr:transposase [Pseudooceanicola endophyticus]MXN21055.1 transposase [Pseudooceanicola albus]
MKRLFEDRGNDGDWFREAFQDNMIRSYTLGRKKRTAPVSCDKRRYKRHNRIEAMFGRLKDRQWVAARYDRYPKTFFSMIALAATTLFWRG